MHFFSQSEGIAMPQTIIHAAEKVILVRVCPNYFAAAGVCERTVRACAGVVIKAVAPTAAEKSFILYAIILVSRLST